MNSFLHSVASFFGGTSNGAPSRDSASLGGITTSTSRGGTSFVTSRIRSSSKDQAFSLPLHSGHSPVLAYGGGSESPLSGSGDLNVPQQATSPFSYPPTRNHTYDYTPSTGYVSQQNTPTYLSGNDSSLQPLSSTSSSASPPSSRAKQQSTPILLLHNAMSTPSSSQSPYPPPAQSWSRLKQWLSAEYPELGDTLNYGIQPAVISSVQQELNLPLPAAVRDSYLAVDGQEVESSAGCAEGLFFGLSFLPLEDALEEWRFWREVDEDPLTGANPKLRSLMKSIPDGYIRKEYSCRGWLPLVTDRAGNYLGVDLYPGENGSFGQVIVFGRDFDTKVVLWNGDGEGGWARWLARFVEDVENGDGFEIAGTGDGSEDSEDDVGYESYYYGPSCTGRGEGGGEGSSGGMRLTGQYKGWNVLEAWADMSLKQWTQAGLYTIEEEKDGKATSSKGGEEDITDHLPSGGNAVLLGVGAGSGVEVPIPVLEENAMNDVSTTPTPDSDSVATPTTPRAAPSTGTQEPPTISGLPPVPQVVLLPTSNDLAPSPDGPQSDSSNSNPSHPSDDEDDEEAEDEEVEEQAGHLTKTGHQKLPTHDESLAQET